MSKNGNYFLEIENLVVGGCGAITDEELFDFEPDKAPEPQEREIGTLTPELRRLFVLMHKQQHKAQSSQQEIGSTTFKYMASMPHPEAEAKRIAVELGELHAQFRKDLEILAFIKGLFRISACELFNVHSRDIAVRSGWKLVVDPDPRLDPESEVNQQLVGLLTAQVLTIVVGDGGEGGLGVVGLAPSNENEETHEPEAKQSKRQNDDNSWLDDLEDGLNDPIH